MYGWIWQRLPGGTAGRTAQVVVLLVAVGLLLWYLVYPWVSLHLSFLQAGVR
jgi:hypothetical protein